MIDYQRPRCRRRKSARWHKRKGEMMTKCGTCGASNAIVNQCRCDPNNLPTMTIQRRIRAGAVCVGRTKIKSLRNLRIFRGILRVTAEWGKYTKRVGPVRLTRIGALDDAQDARADCIATNQLP